MDEQLGKRIGRVENKVDRILTYIEDDERTGRRGLWSGQEDNERRIDAIELEISEAKTIMKTFGRILKIGGTTTAGGIVVSLLKAFGVM